MERVVLDLLEYRIDRPSLLARLRLKEGSGHATKVEGLIREAEAVAHPRAIYRMAFIESRGDRHVVAGELRFESRVLKVNLDNLHRFFAFVVTSGRELDAWANAKTDLLERFWADAINQAVVISARSFLDRFHDEDALSGRPSQGSFIPRESAGLEGLRELVRQSLRAYFSAASPGRALTMDVDAHFVASAKREALMTYEGFRGYGPLIVTWAQTELVLADQFRDGNVSPGKGIKELVDEAYESLPAHPEGWVVSVRSDSAAYDVDVLDHWNDRKWKFAVSADMSRQLHAEIMGLSPQDWQLWEVEKGGFVREWAEVPYVPSRSAEKKETKPYRYLAIRIRSPQGVLFSDGNKVKTFAVVTNDWETGGRVLLEWHRGKAGTVEHTHHILKDELAAGVYPSGKFGADAAWLRLQVLTHNLLVLMKATALDEEYRKARPKRLRFAIFNHVGRVVHHARDVFIRLHRWLLDGIVGAGLVRLRLATWPAG